jgi:N-acetylmuramate 1-kinase
MSTLKNAPDSPLPEPVRTYVARRGFAAEHSVVIPLTGDASDRRYFRLMRRGHPSVVIAQCAAPFDPATLPFINVADLLSKVPVPIPAILDQAPDLGILLQQDLGDVTLQAHLGAASPAEHASLYREAMGLIATIQRRGQDLASPAYIPYGIAFDVPKLTWEMEFFTKHFCVGYCGAVFPDDERAALTAEWQTLVTELANEPRVLCHRDYHSRNLMWHDGRLFMIDFQDARMGPDTYDLVSLLRDSYVDIGEPQLEDLLAYFLALQGVSDTGDAAREFRRRFDLMALQRNLKALGTFGYQAATRANPVYIQYIPRTLRYARAALLRYARFERLHALLAAHVPELR